MKIVWGMRNAAISESNKKHVKAIWSKAFGNSLTGKLAQRPENRVLVLNPKKRLDDSWEPVDRDMMIWEKKTWRIPECGYVHWSAYLTAAARIELHKQLVADGCDGETAVMCDTDCVRAIKKRTHNIGRELGQWMDEGPAFFSEYIAPKAYREREMKPDGKIGWKMKAKGIPGIERLWDRWRMGKSVTSDKGVNTFRTAIKKGDLFSRKKLTRTLLADGIHFGDRILENGLTRPRKMEDMEYV